MALKVKKTEQKHQNPANETVKKIIEKDDLVHLNFQITKAKRQAVKAKVAAEGRKIGDVMNELVDKYLDGKI